MSAAASLDAGTVMVLVVMGVVIVAPTILLVLAVVLWRHRNPKDDP